MDDVRPTRRFLYKLESGLLIALGISATGLMFGNAVGRYLLGTTLVWAEEVIRMLFVWAMFLAITTSFLRNEHIGFDGLVKRGGTLAFISGIVQAACLAGVGAILLFFGYRYLALTGDVPLPATNLPTALFMWPGILAGASWTILGITRLVRLVSGRRGGGR